MSGNVRRLSHQLPFNCHHLQFHRRHHHPHKSAVPIIIIIRRESIHIKKEHKAMDTFRTSLSPPHPPPGKAKLCTYIHATPSSAEHASESATVLLRVCAHIPLECQLKGIPLVAFANSASSSSFPKSARIGAFLFPKRNPREKLKSSQNVISG